MDYVKKYPVLTITGPRQSGKTTLCRQLFAAHAYFSLEDLDVRARAVKDPRSFLEGCLKTGAVLDEIQRAPELTSYIQGIVDEQKIDGQFILTGSQNFQLYNTISQSLAGRTALATLLPFSFQEIYAKKKVSIDRILFKGFYPRIHDKKLDPSELLGFYLSTYLERDIRSLLNVKDLSKFELFLKLCASRTGQILNMSSIANDCGITHNTAKSWLSLLEASYIIHFVRPHHKNFRKRLVKSPKLFFVDVGLAAYLLEIFSETHIANHPLRGALFETFVVSEILKQRFNSGQKSNLYYFRDNVGNEVDLIMDFGLDVICIEIKSGQTVNQDYFKGINYYRKLNDRTRKSIIVYGGRESYTHAGCDIMSYLDIARLSAKCKKN
jgi:hypothetical protein